MAGAAGSSFILFHFTERYLVVMFLLEHDVLSVTYFQPLKDIIA